MATLKQGLSSLTAEGLVAKAEHVHAQLTAHAVSFPAPSPTLVALDTAKENLLTAIGVAIDGGRSAHQAKRDKFRLLKNMLKQLADYVANVASGDAQLIIDGGFETRAERQPTHIPVAPANLEALTPDVTDAVKIEWKGSKRVRLYQVQLSATDPAVTPAWTVMGLTSKRHYTVTDLEPFKMYWLRVIAVNVAGESLPATSSWPALPDPCPMSGTAAPA
ncbi:MAG: fibronectin type III domain-containing protein [Flavobacteriales bacterium]|nr:fibronectin type III domain-containing protein [Flavobacteriales bacterium]